MNQILFATGNSRKISEAQTTLQPYDIEVETAKIDIEEIQHPNPTEITKAKARAAYDVVKRPVVVSDTSWEIPALGGFPGGYMKDIGAWLDTQDWIAIMAHHDDKTIYCHEHVAYYDGETLEHFQSTYIGKFIDEPRGRIHDEESFERVVVMYGTETMAEQLANGDVASAGSTLEHWMQFGEWYSAKS